MTRYLSAAPVLKVANAAKSIEWYRRCFGFAVDAFPDADHPDFAILRRDGAMMMLQQVIGYVRPMLSRPGGIWDVHLDVEDARRVQEVLVGSSGVTALRTKEYCRLEFEVQDPDGHVIVVGQELTGDGPK